MTLNPAITASQSSALHAPTPLVPSNGSGSGNSSGFSFGDVLDAINPLQHIPIVSNLYRAATGSHISSASQIAGDTLYGALLPGGAIAGLASSVANVAVKAVTGKDIGEIAMSAVTSSPSASFGSSTSTATPLVANAASANNAAAATGGTSTSTVSLVASLSRATQDSNNRYQRAQALDALNQKLIKMTA